MRIPATVRLVPTIVWRSAAAGAVPLDARLLQLLAGIKKHATLRAAATATGMSYRAAWGLLGDIDRTLGVPLVELQQGRGARLTAAGEQLLAANEQTTQRLQAEDALELRVEKPRHRPARAQLTVAASHDLLLAAFCDQWAKPEGVIGELNFSGSVESLKAYSRNEADVAGFHTAAPIESGGGTSIRRLLDPRRDALIRFAEREQGLLVPKGNPKQLRSLADVAARGARFVNRQRGSGTRLLIDHLLRQAEIAPTSIHGYDTEEYTHLAVAATIAANQADAGFGLKAAAHRLDLAFVPLQKETYWLVVRARRLESDAVRRLCEGLRGDPLRRAAHGLPGYTLTEAGMVTRLATATG